MKSPKHIYCDLFRQNIYSFYKWSEKDFHKYMTKHYIWDKTNYGDGYCVHMTGDNNEFVVWVRDTKDAESILVHELIHLKNMLFNFVGQKLCSDNDEFEAYYTQRLFKLIASKN